jgi:hypothetical protein
VFLRFGRLFPDHNNVTRKKTAEPILHYLVKTGRVFRYDDDTLEAVEKAQTN